MSPSPSPSPSSLPLRDDQMASKHISQPETKQEAKIEYPSNQKRVVVVTALFSAMFLITLDQNIISTAIPRITDEFNSIDDIGWYGSAYSLTMCTFQLVMGKVYKFYPAKPLFLTCITLFEVGSAVCGSAPSSKVLIIGRAIAGIGSSGIYSGAMLIIFHTIPLQQRPMYQGFGGAVFALASVVGPLLGGTFTDKVTWRWCFYINLPIGAIVILVIILILHLPNQKVDEQTSSWNSKLKQLDPIGNLVFFPAMICLILALQWGGTEYSWKNAHIIVLLVFCGVLCLTFVGIQIWKQEAATVPPRLLKQRSIAASLWFMIFSASSMMVLTYYLPIWFQAIKGVSAVRSGIMLLPMILSTVLSSIASGIVVTKLGYYTQFFILSSILMSIGAGLFTTLTRTTGQAELIGYQIMFGIGAGFGIQQPMNVAQALLDRSDIATGSAVVMFTRFLGSVIFLPIAQNVFLSSLLSKLTDLPNVDPRIVIDGGVTNLRNLATGDDLDTLLSDYNAAIVDVFYLVLAMAAASSIGSLLVEWRSLESRVAKAGKPSIPEEPLKAEESVESV